MNRRSALTIAVVVALVGMAAFPMAATAVTDRSIVVEQEPETGEAIVTVADDGTAVENATVTVSSDAAYAGNGTYDTDENGTVVLPEPNGTVSVEVNTSAENVTASTRAELVPREDSLDVSAEQVDGGSTTVTVTRYDEPVEDASVVVAADGEIGGNSTTDANGTVVLDQPEDDTNVTITATDGDRTAETVVELTGVPLNVAVDQRDDGVVVAVTKGGESVENATVDVDTDGDYSGAGAYETDAAGEVVLSHPSENVTIEVTATAGNETAATTASLTGDFAEGDEPFGLAVSRFVRSLQSATVDEPPGQIVSEFVVGTNPGNAGDAPGQSDGGPGSSESAPGSSRDAPGQSDRDGADDRNGTADDSPAEEAGGNAPDDAGPDGNEEPDGSDDSESTDAGEEPDRETGSDDADEERDDGEGDDTDGGEAADEEERDDEGETEDDEEERDDSGGNGGRDGSSSGAPGNSGNAPGRN